MHLYSYKAIQENNKNDQVKDLMTTLKLLGDAVLAICPTQCVITVRYFKPIALMQQLEMTSSNS